MTAGEVAFLVIGLVLGVLSGAALIEVLRARPPAARAIRVTVAPNAIQARFAATLSDPAAVPEAAGPARGGPGDRRATDAPEPVGEPVAASRRVRLRSSRTAEIRTAVPSGGRPGDPFRLRPAMTTAERDLVAVPMSLEPDPITTALRATAARTAVAAMAAGRRAGSSAGAWGAGASGVAAASGGAEVGASPEPADPPSPAGDGPCSEERRVADERCAVAVRAREAATAAADTLRKQQRAYDELLGRAERAAAAADPRSVRAAKEQAQQRFRAARAAATTRDDVETGARTWLAEINRINQETREASGAAERDRTAAARLGPTVERLTVEADAARIAAERADEACIAAREAVAACDEASRVAEPPATPAAGEAPAPPEDGSGRIAAATRDPEDEFEFSTPMRSSGGSDASILRILRGDRDALERAVARLAGDDPDERRRRQAQLGALADALVARSIEASAFDFPVEHAFWGPFNQAQSRDIMAGLSSMGFRFDGYGNWLDERIPTQRDLSLALGYAGVDPMRIRHWPNEAEMRELLADVRVAADEYVAAAAGGMSLGELVTLLGRRADPLTELWNDWGRVRPILLEAG